MIGAELRGAVKPNLNEALGWIGSRVDDIYGAGVGRLEDVWIDPGTGMPRWLLVKEGRFGGRTTLIPFEDATAGAGRVWIPYERDAVREAPEVEPGTPLTQQVESALRAHYAANAPAAVAHSHRNPPPPAPAPGGPYPQPHPQAPPMPEEVRGHARHDPYRHEATPQPQAAAPRGAYPHRHPPGSVEAGSPSALGVPVPPPPSSTAPWPAPAQPADRPQTTGSTEPAQAPPLRPPAPPPRPPAAGPQPARAEPSAFAGHRAIHAVPDPASGHSPGARPSAREGTVALPRVDSLDQPYWVEIELEGGAKISGPVRGLRITPMSPGGRPGGD